MRKHFYISVSAGLVVHTVAMILLATLAVGLLKGQSGAGGDTMVSVEFFPLGASVPTATPSTTLVVGDISGTDRDTHSRLPDPDQVDVRVRTFSKYELPLSRRSHSFVGKQDVFRSPESDELSIGAVPLSKNDKAVAGFPGPGSHGRRVIRRSALTNGLRITAATTTTPPPILFVTNSSRPRPIRGGHADDPPEEPTYDRLAQPLDGNSPPQFPPAVYFRRQGGSVELEVRVNKVGRVTGLRVVRSSGLHWLDASAAHAVRQWRYRPALRDGQPVDCTLKVPIVFSVLGG